MKVTFDPNNDKSPNGIVSFLSWENRELHDAIRKAFHESPREMIEEIIIDRNGVKAVFQAKNSGR